MYTESQQCHTSPSHSQYPYTKRVPSGLCTLTEPRKFTFSIQEVSFLFGNKTGISISPWFPLQIEKTVGITSFCSCMAFKRSAVRTRLSPP